MVLQRCPYTRPLGCPHTYGLAHSWSWMCPCTRALARGLGHRRLAAAIVIVVSQALGSCRTPGDLRRRRASILLTRFLDATSLERPRLFKAIGASTAMPRRNVATSGRCSLRSSVSTSTV